MMTLQLNLLSEAKKKKVVQLSDFLFLKNLLGVTAFTSAVLAIFLLLGWSSVVNEYALLAESAIFADSNSKPYDREIRRVDVIVRELTQSTKGYWPVMPKLAGLAQVTPECARLTSFELDKDALTVVITGIAKTRACLLDYHSQLKTLSWEAEISAPASELFQKENLIFDIKIGIKPEI